ncbi:hypothetical protein AB1K70_00510 [Bremerella sp. JC770]|uniref:hypothetical protein n=1 Tax=Bremerella sp. JC770 TaxID=3232137 RepID=UPI003459A3DB
MSRIGYLLLLSMLLSAATAMAQDRFEAMQYGSVVDEQGRPVPNVEVRGLWKRLHRSPFPSSLVVTRTDQKGKFAVPLPAGEVSGIEFLVSDESGLVGYVKRDITRLGEPVHKPAKVLLKPGYKYHVEVKDADGNVCEDINVSVMPAFLGKFVQQTDAQGKATIFAPIEHRADAIVAWKRERGIDYVMFDRFGEIAAGRISQLHKSTVEMKLTSWKSYRIRVVDLDKKPLAHVALTPKGIHVIERGLPVTSGNLMTVYTDDKGWADVRVPDNSPHPSILVQKPGWYTYDVTGASLYSDGPIKMVPMIPIKGSVLNPDGSPAEGVPVFFNGANEPTRRFQEFARTDHDGKFYAEVPGNSYCIVFAKTNDLAASPVRLVVHHDRPVQPGTLKLAPMTQVFGKLTDRNGQPLKNGRLSFRQADGKWGEYFETLPVEQRLTQGPKNSSIFNGHYTRADEEGKYEILLPKGQYEISLEKDSQSQQFTINSGEPKELDLQNRMLPERMLRGRLIAADESGCSVAKARILGLAQNLLSNKKFYYASFHASCNSQGEFETKLLDLPYVIAAKSQDERCQGLVFVHPDTDNVDIRLDPVMEVTGTLLEPDGTPVAKRSITANLEFEYDGQTHTAPGKWGTTTDADGRFKLSGLIARQKYTVRVLRDVRPGEIGQRLEFAMHFNTEENNANQDLGEVRIASPEN